MRLQSRRDWRRRRRLHAWLRNSPRLLRHAGLRGLCSRRKCGRWEAARLELPARLWRNSGLRDPGSSSGLRGGLRDFEGRRRHAGKLLPEKDRSRSELLGGSRTKDERTKMNPELRLPFLLPKPREQAAEQRDAGKERISRSGIPQGSSADSTDQVAFSFPESDLAGDLAVRERRQVVGVARPQVAQNQIERQREFPPGVQMRRGGNGNTNVLVLNLGEKAAGRRGTLVGEPRADGGRDHGKSRAEPDTGFLSMDRPHPNHLIRTQYRRGKTESRSRRREQYAVQGASAAQTEQRRVHAGRRKPQKLQQERLWRLQPEGTRARGVDLQDFRFDENFTAGPFERSEKLVRGADLPGQPAGGNPVEARVLSDPAEVEKRP